jgi:hypothetical protein
MSLLSSHYELLYVLKYIVNAGRILWPLHPTATNLYNEASLGLPSVHVHLNDFVEHIRGVWHLSSPSVTVARTIHLRILQLVCAWNRS